MRWHGTARIQMSESDSIGNKSIWDINASLDVVGDATLQIENLVSVVFIYCLVCGACTGMLRTSLHPPLRTSYSRAESFLAMERGSDRGCIQTGS